MAGIPLSSGFNLSSGIPLDLRTVVNDINERDSIPLNARYKGLLVFVTQESKYYYLKNGVTNSDWEELSFGAHTHQISDIISLQTILDSKLDTSEIVSTATANKILKLNNDAKLPADITGNAQTATKLQIGRTFTIGNTGKIFDGSTNITWSLEEIGAAAETHTHTKSNITDFSHTHTKSDITDFAHTHQVSDITNFSHTHTKLDITDFAHTHVKSDITDFTHTHLISEVVDLQNTLDQKVNISDYNDINVLDKIKNVDGSGSGLDADLLDGLHSSDFALTSHTHTISNITNLQNELNGKVNKTGDTITGNLVINGIAALNRTTVDSRTALRFNIGTKTYGLFNEEPIQNGAVTPYHTRLDLIYTQNIYPIPYSVGYSASLYPLVQENIILDGHVWGYSSTILRNYAQTFTDNGTFIDIIGCMINYGHSNSNSNASPITTRAYGLSIQPTIKTGTITRMCDIILLNEFTGGTVIDKWGIYQENNKNNYFNGRIGIKISPSYELDVNGNARIFGIGTGVVLSNGGVLSGLNGSNTNVLYHNGGSWIAKSLTPNDIGALQSYSNSQTIPANTSNGAWYRIATSSSGVVRCNGIFELEFTVPYYHGTIAFRAGNIYNSSESIYISKLGGTDYLNGGNITIERVRIVYKSNSYSGEYSYVEVFIKNYNTTSAGTLYTRLFNSIGWSLTTGSGGIPSGYQMSELFLNNQNPYYSTNDLRRLLTVSNSSVTIDLRYSRGSTVAISISGNTTINMNYVYNGAVGNILLYLSATATITLGTITNSWGSTIYKHVNGTLSNLSSGYYIISYKCIPDPSGTWRIFFNVSSKYS